MRHRSSIAYLAALAIVAIGSHADAQGRGFGGLSVFHGSRHGGGHAGGARGGIGRARAAVYEVIAVSAITDAAGFKTTMAKLGPSLAGTNGRLLVDADDPSVVAGTSPSRLAIVLFDDTSSAHNWQSSPAFKTFSDELIKEATVQISVAGGIADPGPSPGQYIFTRWTHPA